MSQPQARPLAVLDHLVLAAGPEGLEATFEPLAATARARRRPRAGCTRRWAPPTRSSRWPTAPTSRSWRWPTRRSRPGRRSAGRWPPRQHAGGGWVGWAAAAADLRRAGRCRGRRRAGARRRASAPARTAPRCAGAPPGSTAIADEPVLPFLIAWDVAEDDHPSHAAPGTARPPRVRALELAGDPHALRRRLGGELAGVRLTWVGVSGWAAGRRARRRRRAGGDLRRRRCSRAPTLAVYLEQGAKRVFACARDWPGWCRSGKTDEAALADAARLRAALRGRRRPGPAWRCRRTTPPGSTVVERVPGRPPPTSAPPAA